MRASWRGGFAGSGCSVAKRRSKNQPMKKFLSLPVLLGLSAIYSSAYAGPFIPGDVASAGYGYVVPDMLLWYNMNGYYTNGPIQNASEQVANLGNWEPTISVLGDSVFLVGANTFADDGTQLNQRFVVVFQPVAGGAPKIGDSFFADNGTPFRGQINLSRQDGNPQRVAGDKRVGATTFLTMAESSPGQLPGFQSNTRWTNNPMYQANNRYASEQLFTLSSSLVQTPVAKAWDYVYGPLLSGVIPDGNGGEQLSRAGGTIAALDNGNFVIVIDDKTCFSSPAGEVATLAIITPTGSVVKSATLVDARDIWDNVCAFKGGFAVRCHDTLYFYDNAGTPKATNTVASSGIGFDTGRGDGTRVASDIRSRFVYMAGAAAIPEGPAVQLAIWNGTNGVFVTNAVVSSDMDATVFAASDVNLAVDLSDRVCVAYTGKPDTTVFTKEQIIARVVQFNGELINGPNATTNANVKFATPSFFPFKCSDTTNSLDAIQGFTTWVPSVAMTKDAICIAAKGTVNSQSDPTLAPDTAAETTIYTVIAQPYVPGGIESVGLTRIVPDRPIPATPAGDLPSAAARGNWEPYSSVLGTSTFLIESSTFALFEDGSQDPDNQREVVAFQPVAGGAMKLGEVFFADNGTPFRLANNLSRQNGNPGRVVGDKRPGATNFLTLAETSVGQLGPFQSNNRWANNPMYLDMNRYVTEQSFGLSSDLVQTPLAKAWDYVYGPLVSAEINPADAVQLSRTGGTGACLDNGNWVVAIDDKTGFSSAGEVATFAIITPTGSIVKSATLVAAFDLWDNVTSYKGGFCVRVHNVLYFYDNDGNLKGQIDQTVTGITYDAGRGDGTRIAGHINSPYVYLMGANVNTTRMCLSVFDSRDQSFVTEYDVSEPGFQSANDRANLCVDALNRITATWVTKPEGFAQQQVAARVLAFDGSTKTVSPLTHSFWVFVNAITVPQADNLIRTLQMFPAMTTKEICVAAKGEINLQNQPQNGPNSQTELNFYTVFTHPDPQDDPTTPVGGEAPKLTIAKATATTLTISWPTSATGFTLESKNSLSDATWTTVGTANPATVTIGTGNKFYRLRN